MVLPAAVLAAMVSSHAAHSRRRDAEGLVAVTVRHIPLSRGTVLVMGAVGLSLALWVGFASPPTIEEDMFKLNEMSTKGVASQEFEDAAAAAIRRHPAAYMLHLSLGRHYLATRNTKALTSLNRALLLFPQSPQVHLEVARTLRAMGQTAQAVLEYRLAMTYGDRRQATLAEAMELCKDWTALKKLLPENEVVMWRAMRILLSWSTRGETERLLTMASSLGAHATALHPKDEKLALTEMEVASASTLYQCQREDADEANCAKVAAENLDRARNTAKNHPGVGSFIQWSTTARLAGDTEEATQVLVEGLQKFPLQIPLSFALAKLYLAQNKLTEAEQVARQALNQASRRSEMASAHMLLAKIMKAGNRLHTARYHVRKAQSLRGQ